MIKRKVFLGFMVLALITFYNCDSSDNNGGDSNNTIGDPPSAISANIFINGTDMTGKTVVNPGQNDRLKLRGQFSDPQGNNTIQMVTANYSHGSGMMGHMGDYTLWDDGTHGDDVPHDGWYCLEDDMEHMMSMMGMGWGSHMGEHEYEFYCFDEDGHESNHITVLMNVR